MTSETLRSTHRFSRVAIAGVTAGVILAGCGGSGSSSANPAASTSPTTVATTSVTVANGITAAGGSGAVDVRQFQYVPAELAVKVGTNVTWTNHDDILHTATSGATPGSPDGKFDGPMDARGKTFSHTFDQPGRYPYFCNRHNSMTGAIVVQ